MDWAGYDQYKADFHAHSKNSDGGNLTYEMVEDHYEKGFDILAMTDHNYTMRGWENAHEGAMSIERKNEIEAGVVSVEIVNKIDNESRYDRILWDNILQEMLPEGRQVWGYSNDDTHSLNATGYSFNMMLMPELSIPATRSAMENGTFYAVSRVSRVDGINANLPDGSDMPGSGRESTLYLLDQPTPTISNITVDQEDNVISIEGADYHTVEWIADGEVIATGNTIDLNDYEDVINSYVRAQLKSDTGIAFTQPFSLQIQEPAQIVSYTYDSNGGRFRRGANTRHEAEEGTAITLATRSELGLARPGYRFLGWSVKGSSEILEPGSTYVLDGPTQFVAVWSKI